MSSKNFLDQFSNDNKPESFQKEVFVPSSNPKKHINITVIIICSVVLVLGIFATWFFLLRPTIEVPSFIGLEEGEVNSWIRQQGIQMSGIDRKEEYSEDYDSKIVIYQSIDPGKKVKKNVIFTFVVSKGPDPNVEIKVPDIISLNLTQIQDWINTNKLTGVKITYEFSDEDPLDSVISYDFGSNASETNFKRSSSLNIIVSKGKQEDQPVTVPNFTGKTVAEVTNWGSKNKIKIIQKEDYSSTVNKDMIISQSVNPGKKITSKESLTITVSKGTPIIAPDFSSYSKENILAWGSKNNVNIEIIERYSKDVDKDKVIEQSRINKPCNDGMSVTVSLGNISKDDFTGNTYKELEKWVNGVNKNGANLSLSKDKFPNKQSDDVELGFIYLNDFNVGSSLSGYISDGKYVFLEPEKWPELTNEGEIVGDSISEDVIRDYCKNKGLTCTFSYEKGNVDISKIISIKIDGGIPQQGTYITQAQDIKIVVCSEKESS